MKGTVGDSDEGGEGDDSGAVGPLVVWRGF